MKRVCEYVANNRAELKLKIEGEILFAWQPLAAIAERCGATCKETFYALRELENELKVQGSKFRLDGHNKSVAYRKVRTIKVMNVFVAVQDGEREEEFNVDDEIG